MNYNGHEITRRHIALVAFVGLFHPVMGLLAPRSAQAFDTWAEVATAILQIGTCVATMHLASMTRSWFTASIMGLCGAVALAYVNQAMPPVMRMQQRELAIWCASMPAATCATKLLFEWAMAKRQRSEATRRRDEEPKD